MIKFELEPTNTNTEKVITKSLLKEYNKIFNHIVNSFNPKWSVNQVLDFLNTDYKNPLYVDLIKDTITGIWSGIPNCCNYDYSINHIYAYVFKEKYINALNKDDFYLYNYVPCINCFKKKHRIHLKENGYFKYTDEKFNGKKSEWHHY